MTDILGYRHCFGVLGPSTNTIVQPDIEAMRHPASPTTTAASLPPTPPPSARLLRGWSPSDQPEHPGRSRLGDNLRAGLAGHGQIRVTFFGGVPGADAFLKTLQDASGLTARNGSHACRAALQTYGGIRRSRSCHPTSRRPTPRSGATSRTPASKSAATDACNAQAGPSLPTSRPTTIRDIFQPLDGDDVDAIVQVGTNLSPAELCAAAELWLGKPIIAINTAIYWHALRMNGIADKIPGYGRMLEDF